MGGTGKGALYMQNAIAAKRLINFLSFIAIEMVVQEDQKAGKQCYKITLESWK